MKTKKLRIYVRRDGELRSDGCWGGENASYPHTARGESDARAALESLGALYPDTDWVLRDEDSQLILAEIEATECEGEEAP